MNDFNTSKTIQRTSLILVIIVFSQFCCTSLWFASNAVLRDISESLSISSNLAGHITSAVQLGFISGTLVFAILSIADRFSPSLVFLICALLGAMTNLGVIWPSNTLFTVLLFRFLTGFFLAGIYPVGMKIASDYYNQGLGLSLSLLVGALVLGTSFSHFLSSFDHSLNWVYVIYATSALAIIGGFAIYAFVPDGPYRKPAKAIKPSAFFSVFNNRPFRGAALGYFGHMWELYAFWTFVPLIIANFNSNHSSVDLPISSWSFYTIGIGAVACILGGIISRYLGNRLTAISALSLSCLCCLVSPWMIQLDSQFAFIAFILFWGMVVIADSPLFSTMVAQFTEPETKGTALTIVNCIGFAISIVSIQLISMLWDQQQNLFIFTLLSIGPILGLISLRYLAPHKLQS